MRLGRLPRLVRKILRHVRGVLPGGRIRQAVKQAPLGTMQILGPMTLNGTALSRYAASCAVLLQDQGHAIRFVDAPAPAAGTDPPITGGIVILRSVLQALRARRLRPCLAALRHTPRLIFVRDRLSMRHPGHLMLSGLCWGLSRLARRRFRMVCATEGPARAVFHAGGKWPACPAPRYPEAAARDLFSDQARVPPRFSADMAERARLVERLADDAPLAAELRSLHRIAAHLRAVDILAAHLADSMPGLVEHVAKARALLRDRTIRHLIMRAHRTGLPPATRNIDPPHLSGCEAELLSAIRTHLAGRPLSDGLARRLLMPIGCLPGAMTPLQWVLALLIRPELSAQDMLIRPWTSPTLRRKVQDLFGDLAGPDMTQQDMPGPPAVAGDISDDTGLGRNLRMNRIALSMAMNGPTPGVLPRQIILHHTAPHLLPEQIFLARGGSGGGNPYQIGFVLWEFQRFAAAQRLGLSQLDEIWAPSRFVASALRRITDRPVIVMGKGITLPRLPPPAPRPTGFEFLMAFDGPSSAERKNPLAAVQAFQRAFAGRVDVRLTIKTTPTEASHWGDPMDQMATIRQIAASDTRMTLVEARIPFRRLLAMIRDADCLLSPHRAEGFGYVPAYAMLLGTPVIATDYSGTTDFLTEATGYPVRHRPVPVQPGHSMLPITGAEWAEIDIDHLASRMVEVETRPAQAILRAAAARELMRDKYGMAGLSARYRDRLQALAREWGSTQDMAAIWA